MLDPDIVLVRVSRAPDYQPDGTVTEYIRVEFMVAKHGPFVERFTRADYSAMTRDLTLNAFAREVRAT